MCFQRHKTHCHMVSFYKKNNQTSSFCHQDDGAQNVVLMTYFFTLEKIVFNKFFSFNFNLLRNNMVDNENMGLPNFDSAKV